jgi:hypothetical protein
VSTQGPTTCTVYEPGYATQIIVDSRRLNVASECQVWSGNGSGGGYLWGYEHAAAMPDGLRLCSLIDPYRNLTATVIEETGDVPVTAAQRASGMAACANIRASGWTKGRSKVGKESRIRAVGHRRRSH